MYCILHYRQSLEGKKKEILKVADTINFSDYTRAPEAGAENVLIKCQICPFFSSSLVVI